MKILRNTTIVFFVFLLMMLSSCSESVYCNLTGQNAFTFDSHEHFICYRPMRINGNWYWTRGSTPNCDNQSGSGKDKKRFAKDWEELECDCFFRFNSTKQDDVYSNKGVGEWIDVEDGLNIYRGSVPKVRGDESV